LDPQEGYLGILAIFFSLRCSRYRKIEFRPEFVPPLGNLFRKAPNLSLPPTRIGSNGFPCVFWLPSISFLFRVSTRVNPRINYSHVTESIFPFVPPPLRPLQASREASLPTWTTHRGLITSADAGNGVGRWFVMDITRETHKDTNETNQSPRDLAGSCFWRLNSPFGDTTLRGWNVQGARFLHAFVSPRQFFIKHLI